MSSTLPTRPSIWSGIQPKSYACNTIPQVDPNRIPWNKESKEKENFFTHFQAELKKFSFTDQNLKDLDWKAGPSSTDSKKELIRDFLSIIYARWIGKLDNGFGLSPVTQDDKVSLTAKLKEGVENCGPGFVDRLQDLVNGLSSPATFDEFLCAIRKDLVEQTSAAHSEGEVHAKHRFQTLAAGIYNTPIPVEDCYTGALTPAQIQSFLAEKFSTEFTFMGILNAFIDQLRSQLLKLGYLGPNPSSYSGGYTNHWKKFQKLFCTLFGDEEIIDRGTAAGAGAGSSDSSSSSQDDGPRMQGDWFVIDDESSFTIDIQWSYVLKRLATKLISEDYVRLKATDLVALSDAKIYDPEFARSETYSAGDDQASIFSCPQKSILQFFKHFPAEMAVLARSSLEMKSVLEVMLGKAEEVLFKFIKENPACVKHFLKLLEDQKGPDTLTYLLNYPSTKPHTPLTEAASQGNLKLVTLFLEKGSDIDAIGTSMETALGKALKEKQWKTAELLIEKVSRIILDPPTKVKIFFEAVKENTISIVSFFLKTDALLVVNSRNTKDQNSTPLIAACYGGYTEMAEALIQQGADINALDAIGNSALMWAIGQEHWETVRFLLDQSGINSNGINSFGNTALMAAAFWKAPIDIIHELLAKGAAETINHRDQSGKTALDWAVEKKRFDVVRLLIQAGATITESQALALLKEEFSRSELNQMLIDQLWEKLNPDDQIRIFFDQVKANKLEIVLSLMDKKPELTNARSLCKVDSNSTPLIVACYGGYTKMAEALIQRGTNINAVNTNGDSALTCAIYKEHWETVGFLLDQSGINPNFISCNGNIALILAVSWNAPIQVIQRLLGKGATETINQRRQGKTALDWAIEEKRFDVAECLVYAGAEVTLKQMQKLSVTDLQSWLNSITDLHLFLKLLSQTSADFCPEKYPISIYEFILVKMCEEPLRPKETSKTEILSTEELLTALSRLNLNKKHFVDYLKTSENEELKQKALDTIFAVNPKSDATSLASRLFWKKRIFTKKSADKGTLGELSALRRALPTVTATLLAPAANGRGGEGVVESKLTEASL